MIDRNEIEAEIKKLEESELTYASASKLADLYTIRNNLKGALVASYSYGASEFLQVCNHVPIENVLNVLDEHMECIKALYPKEYSALIRKLKM